MAVSVEDKIELFRNLIFKDIEKFAFEKKGMAVKNFEQEKNRLLQDIKIKKNHILEESVKRAEKEKQQLIARVKSQGYHRLLDKRQQFINEIAELLIQKAKNFVSEEGYREYLSRSIVKAAVVFENSDPVQLYFTKRDLEVLGEFISQCLDSGELNGKYLLKEAEKDIIGGFYAEDDKKEMQADYTLKSLIEENQELIGNNISRRLDEV